MSRSLSLLSSVSFHDGMVTASTSGGGHVGGERIVRAENERIERGKRVIEQREHEPIT
jgi:hypothetical protein